MDNPTSSRHDGPLTHVGVPEEHAHHYAEGVRRGGTLITVNAPHPVAARVAALMNQHHAVDVNERASQWRHSGWKGFDASAPALSADEVRRERLLYTNRDLSPGPGGDPGGAEERHGGQARALARAGRPRRVGS